jgi:hypothetical protein
MTVFFTAEDCVYMDQYSRLVDTCELLEGTLKAMEEGLWVFSCLYPTSLVGTVDI